MPDLDLTTATEVRFGDVDALAVRFGDVDVWTKPSPGPEYDVHTVFDPAAAYPFPVGEDTFPPDTVTYADAFYLYGAAPTDAEVYGARLWIPAGVTAATVDLHLFWTDIKFGSGGFAARHSEAGAAAWMAAPTETVTVPITGTGQWVQGIFPAAHPLIVDAPVHIGYTMPDSGAIWADGQTESFVTAHDAFQMVLAESSAGTPLRSRRWTAGAGAAPSNLGRVYGVDILTRVPVA